VQIDEVAGVEEAGEVQV
jgi:hypothetical protein